EGKVERKFINHKNHNDETIVFDNGEETVLISGYREISIGDSVVKTANSFLLRIYKPSDTLELTYMLPCKEKGDFFYGGIQ
ncbi:MAG: hypothetical protein MUC59_03910, partial [Saprospiraceae bacterium]|nr:hypothetical protein [Saprospiraceae bacterium]